MRATNGQEGTTKGGGKNHERHERGRIEPRMDTKGHEGAGGNHEKHERHEKKYKKGEVEPRMDTNGLSMDTNGRHLM